MSSELYEVLLKFRAARDGGLNVGIEDMLAVAAKDPYIDIEALYHRTIDYATRRRSWPQRLDQSITLEQAKSVFRGQIEGEGAKCPCCGRFGKIYRRTLNKVMAASLVWLYQQQGDEDNWVHLPTVAPRWVTKTYQIASLRWWGLVERKDVGQDEDAYSSGLWRVTEHGKYFIQEQIAVPKVAWTYDADLQRLDGPLVYIWQCFKDRFSYDEVKSARFDGFENSGE